MSIANENMNNLLFPQKLHKLLDENLFEEIISWQPHGRSFKVHQKGDFVKKVHPIYFKKTVKYPSFQRQLNYYGFKRQDLSGPDKGGYYHPHFLRGCFSLCTQQVNRQVEREQEADENALPCEQGKMKSLHNKGSEPQFYRMAPLPPLANQEKSKSDKEEFFNDTRRSHDHLHPFMVMGGPAVPPSHSFRSYTNHEYFPRCGHKEWWCYPSNTEKIRPPRKDGWNHVVSDFCSAPSLSYDYDGRQNYHPFDPYNNPYEHHIMVENATASSNIEMHNASLPNGNHSHDSHDAHFDNYHYTNDDAQKTLPALVPPADKSTRNIPRRYFSFVHDRPGICDEKREDESGSSSKDALTVSSTSSTIQQKISPYKNKECSQEQGFVQVEPPSLLTASSTFDEERDPIEPAVAVPSSSARSLNEVVYSTMMVPGAVRMSDPSLLSKDEYRKSGRAIARSEEEDADIFGHRAIEEKALLDEARQCINRDSFEWDDTFLSSSYSFS